MTQLLTKAFEKVAMLPQEMQDEIAEQLLEDVLAESKWDETFAKSQDKLAKLADRALEEFRAGRTQKMGFDEL